MPATTGVFLPDEQEQRIPTKSPRSVRANGDEAKRVEPAKTDYADPAKLSVDELKAAIVAAWKKHEALAKAELAPMLYWLRDKLSAQGSRNDLHDKDRGWEIWVIEHLDISRRTADRWCAWYAKEVGLVPTSGHVAGSDAGPWEDILNDHENQLQIAFNCWVPKAMHAKYQKALSVLQKKFGLKNKKEALVRGVIYAATVIDEGATKRGSAKVVGNVSLRRHRSTVEGRLGVRKAVRAAHGRGKTSSNVRVAARVAREVGLKQRNMGTNGHGEGRSSKAMRAAAGR